MFQTALPNTLFCVYVVWPVSVYMTTTYERTGYTYTITQLDDETKNKSIENKCQPNTETRLTQLRNSYNMKMFNLCCHFRSMRWKRKANANSIVRGKERKSNRMAVM